MEVNIYETCKEAYCLGDENVEIKKFMAQGRLVKIDESHWRVFSREATEGELAQNGDYIKVDSNGFPYPNEKEYFEKNHIVIDGMKNEYEQIPQLLKAWDVNEPECPEIYFLIEHKGLIIDTNKKNDYFSAPLWGDILTADKGAKIVFYNIRYDEQNNIIDAEFNFVAGDEFLKTYEIVIER
jgi:hypothetical protein